VIFATSAAIRANARRPFSLSARSDFKFAATRSFSSSGLTLDDMSTR
jgi:hypothetical protein